MNIISHEHGPSSKGCPKDQRSEMKDTFTEPFVKKPTPTRARRLEQFMWQELYNEYIRHHYALKNAPIERSSTEYYDEYCKHSPKEDPVTKEVLINRYPLYSTAAITIYNHNGDTGGFKKCYSITRPVDQQREQFG